MMLWHALRKSRWMMARASCWFAGNGAAPFIWLVGVAGDAGDLLADTIVEGLPKSWSRSEVEQIQAMEGQALVARWLSFQASWYRNDERS